MNISTSLSAQVWGETKEKVPVFAEDVIVTYQIASNRSSWIYANVSQSDQDLVSAGLVSVVDAVILKDAFTSYDIAQDCLEQVNGYESYGVYLKGLDKTRQMNLLDSYTQHMNRFHKIMMKFGVTPEARTRMRVKPKEKDDGDLLKELMGNG